MMQGLYRTGMGEYRTVMGVLGYSGVLPFYVFALLPWASAPSMDSLVSRGFEVYSLVILSFLAGTLWGSANVRQGRDKISRLMVSNLLVLLAAAAFVFATPFVAALCLRGLHLVQLWYEIAHADQGWYLRLRCRLTLYSMPSYLVYVGALLA